MKTLSTTSELLDTVALGENSEVEFKRDDLRPQDLAKELVALANFEGGIVILGVEDDGTISGIAENDVEQWVMNVCREKIRPPINPSYREIPLIDRNTKVAVVQVSRGLEVHALWHNNSSRCLIRVGSQSREASQSELARLFQQRRSVRAEMQPVSGTSIEDLDRRRLKNYFGQIRKQDIPDDDDDQAWQTILTNTHLMQEDYVTVGGLLLFGELPNSFITRASIRAIAFPGTEKDYDVQEDATLRGPMVPLLNKNNEIVESGLVEEALYFIQRNTRVSVDAIGGRRVTRPVYPRDALREAIVNALIHRDYLLTNIDIELSLYEDRIEIISPGRLPNGVTIENMLYGIRFSRNEQIKSVMRDYQYIEDMGLGIPFKIVKGMREHNGTEPDLFTNGERFTVRLHAKGQTN